MERTDPGFTAAIVTFIDYECVQLYVLKATIQLVLSENLLLTPRDADTVCADDNELMMLALLICCNGTYDTYQPEFYKVLLQ